jgi:hypothetical protein
MQEMWREDEMKFIASMEKEVMESCQTMGLDINTAMMVEQNQVWSPLKFSMTSVQYCCNQSYKGTRKIIELVSGNSRERQAFRFFLFRGLSHRILFDHKSHCVLAVSLDRICSYKHV